MSIRLSLKEALARQGEWQGEPLEQSLSRTPSVRITPQDIADTIALAKAMTGLGVRLWIAHDAVTRLAARETIAVAIPGKVEAIAAALEPFGVTVMAYQDNAMPVPHGVSET